LQIETDIGDRKGRREGKGGNGKGMGKKREWQRSEREMKGDQ